MKSESVGHVPKCSPRTSLRMRVLRAAEWHGVGEDDALSHCDIVRYGHSVAIGMLHGLYMLHGLHGLHGLLQRVSLSSHAGCRARRLH